MSFPNRPFESMDAYMDAYMESLQVALSKTDRGSVVKAAEVLEGAYTQGRSVYVCGNGGSAAIANHMICDHGKLIQTDTPVRVKIFSLCNSMELVTAISNDINYEDIFSYQLRSAGKAQDVLVTISGSGQSANIVKAAKTARDIGMTVVAFTGFSGGESAKLADVNVHVPCDNYAIAEDAHQSLMQMIAQFIRMKHMDPALVPERLF